MRAGDYLASFIDHEKNLAGFSPAPTHLRRVRAVLQKLHNPHQGLRVIHIAGSKGKGSTAAVIASVLRSAGYRVGLYTSPHLDSLRERIRVLDNAKSSRARRNSKDIFCDQISRGEFQRLVDEIAPVLESSRHHPRWGSLTYFEVLTIAAFVYFQKERVDWVVLETGLGGRLDATNVCAADVSVITPISLEHTQQLGDTISKIAFEKAGIIKRSTKAVVTAPQLPEARSVIVSRCQKMGVPYRIARRSAAFRIRAIDDARMEMMLGGKVIESPLVGEHQRDNLLTVLEICKVLRRSGVKVSDEAIVRGIRATVWPLRFERIEARPVMILDGAHNEDSVRRLIETLGIIAPGQKNIFVFGCSRDKSAEGMLKWIAPCAKAILLTEARHPRARKWRADEAAQFEHLFQVPVVKVVRVAAALQRARKNSSKQDPVIVTGSLFVAAEARRAIQKF